MTTAVVFVQRCVLILAVLLCYFHVRGESVDCELYPFHHTCRGTMSRKRAMFPNLYGSGCDGSKDNLNCIGVLEDRHRAPYAPLSKSKLFIALLNDDLQRDIARSARHKSTNNGRNDRESALMENFLSELESSDYY